MTQEDLLKHISTMIADAKSAKNDAKDDTAAAAGSAAAAVAPVAAAVDKPKTPVAAESVDVQIQSDAKGSSERGLLQRVFDWFSSLLG